MHTRHPATGWSNFPPPPWSNFGPPLTAVLVYGPPQILSSAVDRYEDLIEIPGVAQPASSAPQHPGVVEPERLTPVADGFVPDRDAALGEQIFHISKTQAEAEIEPDRVADDLGGKR